MLNEKEKEIAILNLSKELFGNKLDPKWVRVNAPINLKTSQKMVDLIKRLLKRKVDIKKDNYTRVGTPVKVMTATKNGWRFNAGQISRVEGSKVDIWVFPCTGETPYLINDIRHLRFKEKGEPCWDFVAKNYCHSENII